MMFMGRPLDVDANVKTFSSLQGCIKVSLLSLRGTSGDRTEESLSSLSPQGSRFDFPRVEELRILSEPHH
jgi:hypothetical protein